jgi:polysaccharide biosynthesis protein PslH
MATILFLTQRIPYPPNKGDKLRAFHVLNHWTERHKVFLGCLVDDAEDWQHAERLRQRCAGAYFAPLNGKLALVRSARALLTGEPLGVPYYRDRGLAAWVRQVLASQRPDCAFVYSSVMAQYVMGAPHRPNRVLMDFVDVDSEKWAEYAARKSFPARLVYAREARRLLSFDRRVAAQSDASIFVSEPEAALFARRAPEAQAKLRVVPNGIDSTYFSPDNAGLRPERVGTPQLVFTGHMGYWPNVDAVTWFADAVLPGLRRKFPDIALVIVGAHPAPAVEALGRRPGIVVTGQVPDVRPHVAASDVVVAPMRISRGVQNKVLEGMAMAKPVVVTPQALEGIEAEPDRHVLLASDAEAFIGAVARALEPGFATTIGAQARAMVVDRYSWANSLALYDRLLEG